MTDPTITCPSCQSEIKLTESLAGPFLKAKEEALRRTLATQTAELAKREEALREQTQTLQKERDALEEAVASRLAAERKRLEEEQRRKARLELAQEMETKQKEFQELTELLKSRDEKLAEAQKAQAELTRKQRELDDAKRELDLTVEKRVTAGVESARERAQQEAQEAFKLKISEKEFVIQRMQKQLEEMQRKVEQGSQQLQGEVQELELQSILSSQFVRDTIVPVAKGEFGGDVLQEVCNAAGAVCGKILWESKRTKHWSDAWLTKLRDDQRTAKADIAVIVSHALPKGVDTFDMIDNVYVVSPRCIAPVAATLRQAIIELSIARQAAVGRGTKMEMIYQYLIGPQFRQRLQAIVEAFSGMQQDLNTEKKVIMKQWAKRESQITSALTSTVGLFGDLQGIAGKSLQEIEGLSLEALESEEQGPRLLKKAVGAG